MRRRSIYLAILLTLCAGAVERCTPPVSLQTDAAKRAWQADQAVQRIGELENATIDAVAANKVKTADGRTIVQWCVNTIQALKAAPQGWPQSATTEYQSVRPLLNQYPSLATWVPIVDAFVQGVQ